MIPINKPFIGVQPTTPGIAPEIEGAPATMPGGNDGTDKTQMSGTPVATAHVPPPVTNDVAGAPQAGQSVTQPPAPATETQDNGGESKPAPTTDTDTPPTAPTPTDTSLEDERRQAVAGSDRQIKTIQDWMDAEENRPETEEQRKKRERTEKSKKIVAAISDGLSALSNLFFTTRYAPNMYNHDKGSQLNATNDRIERMKAEREKKRDEYLNFSMKLGDIENDRARTLRDLEAQHEARKLAREKAERDAELHKWQAALQPDKQREQKGKADKAESEAVSSQYEAANKPKELELKNATEVARAGSYQASAANSYASAAAHNRSNPEEFTAWDEHGNAHTFRTEDAAIAYAKQHGTYEETDESETSHTTGKSAGRATDTTTTKTKKSGHAARPQKKESPTAGSGGGKKSPTS